VNGVLVTLEEYIRDLHENPVHKDLTAAERHDRVCQFVENPAFQQGGLVSGEGSVWMAPYRETIFTPIENQAFIFNQWSNHLNARNHLNYNTGDITWSRHRTDTTTIPADHLHFNLTGTTE